MSFKIRTLVVLSLLTAVPAHAFFIDGSGNFGLKAETRSNPDFQKDHGTYQATQMSVDVNGEIRANDRASFHLRLGIFEDPSSAYLGDSSKPKDCTPRRTDSGTNDTSCEGRPQSTLDSGHTDYKPVIREAYAKYAFNYCLLSAGRRSRDVGLGILHSSGKKPFDTDASIFDGVTCDVNIQKQQDLGFAFGVDKLQETGAWNQNPYDSPTVDTDEQTKYKSRSRGFGTNDGSDDMDQIFFSITYDDLKTKNPGAFAKQVGIYFSNILSDDTKTDVKFFDLYTGLYFGSVAFKNDILFRMGKTADSNVVGIGGQRLGSDGYEASNNVQSVGLAGNLEYTVAKSGASIGPQEFNEGNFERHVAFIEYAYAPGDKDGYYTGAVGSAIDEGKRDNKAKAMPFHRNFKPAMLMFNGKPSSRYLNKPGIYNTDRFMNASLLAGGYRYESQARGNIEAKLITARLLESMPGEVHDYWDTQTTTDRPIGYYGTNLGYELDLAYTYQYRKEVEIGGGLAGGLPGSAWRTSTESNVGPSIGVMGSFALKF